MNFYNLLLLVFSSVVICKPQNDLNLSLNGKDCKVIEQGSKLSKPCQFPFIYRNRTFYGCTTFDDRDGKAWCSTKIDPFDYAADVTPNGKFYGYCPENECPTEKIGQEWFQNQLEMNKCKAEPIYL